MSTHNKKLAILGRLALLATTIIWGTSFVVLKNTLDAVPVLWILSIRFILAGIIMLLASGRNLKKINKQCIADGILMGVFLTTAYIFQTYGLAETTPGKNAFLTATYCVITPFLYWAVTKIPPDRYNILAALTCVIGVGLVSLQGNFTLCRGDLLTLIGGIMFAFHLLATARGVKRNGAALVTCIQLCTAAVICTVLALFFEPAPTGFSGDVIAAIVYLSFMCTAACFFLQTIGQKYTPPAAASIILVLESVFGVVFSLIFYPDEHLSPRLVAGFALIFFAVVVSETKLEFLKLKNNKKKADF